MKSQIIEQLGETGILLPKLVSEGLRANDRIKVRLSALQAAALHAQDPTRPLAALDAECRQAGLAPATINPIIAGAHMVGDGRVAAPALNRLMRDIVDDASAMINAVEAGDPTAGASIKERLAALRSGGALNAGDEIETARIARLTAVTEQGGDSLHRLVLDLHKQLNRLALSCAEEELSGARVFGLAPQDRPAVEAFMRGLASTRRLKFDHPGLDTLATRSGGRLVIQNDIGTTDAHVVVIAVDGEAVTLTYTDVHRPRAKFLISLMEGHDFVWSGLDHRDAQGLGDDGFYLVTGRLEPISATERDDALVALGAALVFLIDWNKARKLLRDHVGKADAVAILTWAARARIGHRAFLELGGSELIGAAVRNAAPTRIGFGERLDKALGRGGAVDFLKAVLRISTEGLIAGRSLRLVRDHIESDLVRRLESADGMLLAVVMRQAGLAHDIAASLARFVAALRTRRSGDAGALASRAAAIERKADRIAIEARAQVSRLHGRAVIDGFIDRLEDAIDDLEQAAFIASLLPAKIDETWLPALVGLCHEAETGIKAAASGLAAACDIPEGHSIDTDDALACAGRLADAEHAADAHERRLTALVLTGPAEMPGALAVLELARAIERATDRLAGFGHLLRHYVITDLAA